MALSGREVMLVLRARDEASRTLRRLSRTMNAMERERYRKSIEGARVESANLRQIQRAQRDLNDQYRQRIGLLAMDRQAGKLTAEQYKQAMLIQKSVHQQNLRANELDRRATQDRMQRYTDEARQLESVSQAKRDLGYAHMDAGAALTTLGVAAAGAGLLGIRAMHGNIEAVMEYREQVSLTMTQVDQASGATFGRVARLGKQVAAEIPVAFEQIQPALYDIFSSIDTNMAGSRKLLKQFAADAVGGATTMETATRANLAIMNAYGIKVKDVTKVSDFMFQLVRKGVGTYEEFAVTIGRAIPSAVNAGQSIEVLGGMLAFMTRNGLSAAMAATSAARGLDAISHPETIKRLTEMGVVVKNSAGEFRPLPAILDQMNERFGKMTSPQRAKALKELFKSSGGTIQARRFFNMYFKNAEEFNQRTKEMGGAAGAAGEAFGRMADTPKAKLQQYHNLMKIASIEMGAQLLPGFVKLLEFVNKVLRAFDKLSPRMKKFIAYTIAIGAGLLIVLGVGAAVSGMFLMMSGALMLAGTSLGFVAGWIAVIVAAAAGLILIGHKVYKNWDTIGPKLQAVFEPIADWFEGTFGPMFEAVWEGIQDGFDNLVDSFEDSWDSLQDMFESSGFEDAVGGITELFDNLQNEWAPILEGLGKVAGGTLKVAFTTLGIAIEAIVEVIGALMLVVGPLVSLFGKLPGPVQAGVLAFIAFKLGLLGVIATAAAGTASLFTLGTTASMTAARFLTMRNIAGVLGAVVLMLGQLGGEGDKANHSMKTLASTAGGALMGFAVGGPFGAALGGFLGLIKGVDDAQNAARDAFEKTLPVLDDYKDTLDQTTGAMTALTRRTAFSNLQKTGGLTVSRILGIPDKTMIDAALGDVKSMESIAKRVKEMTGTQKQLTGPNADKFFFNKQSAKDFINGLKLMGVELTKNQKEVMELIEAGKTWEETLEGFPKKVVTQFKNGNYPQTLGEVEKLADKYKLQPKEVRTVIKALNIKATKAELRALYDRTRNVKDALNGLPNKVAIKVEAPGFKGTMGQMRDLIKTHKNLSKKQIKMIIKSTGSDLTKKQLQELIDLAKDLNKQNPKPKAGPLQGKDKMGQDIIKLLRDLAGLGQKHVKPTASLINNVSGGITNINTQLNNLARRGPVTVSANFVTTRTTITKNKLVEAATGGLTDASAGVMHLASGGIAARRRRGLLRGPGSGTSDSIPAMLSNGEFVVNAKQTADNIHLIRAINSGLDIDFDALRHAGQAVRLAEGGQVGKARKGGGGGSDGKRGESRDEKKDRKDAKKDRKKFNQLLTKVVANLAKMRPQDTTPRNMMRNLLRSMGIKRTPANITKGIRATTIGKKNDLGLLDRAIFRLHERREDLKKARQDLQRLKDDRQALIDQTRDSIRSFANLSNFTDASDIFGNPLPPTPSGVLAGLQDRLRTVREFGKNLKALLNMGFSKRVYDQVLAMGPEQGSLFAEALLNSTPSQVRGINETLADFTPAIGNINETTNKLHEIGIKAAQGLVRGLKSKVEDARKAARRLGTVVVKELRRVLKIKSPSKEALSIANNVGGTLTTGLSNWERPLRSVSTDLGHAMLPTYANSAAASPVGGGSARAGGVNIKQDIHITTQEIDPRRHAAELGWQLAARYRT